MKRLIFALITFVAAVCCGTIHAEGGPQIKFEQTKVEMGTVKASGGQVTATYHFTNTGDKPLVIKKVTNGGCGCTTPSYPKAPIQPGARGTVTIKFNPEGRRGEFNRTVKVSTNASSKRQSLKFSGVIVP